ncbi:hypothetical protein B0H14DRAFT_2586562 [Mycena olivaceomarginata]|nr:hypothetical protein B0H14DRAFT_2586562 [Mycena olivaceomarginata]
MIDLVKLLFCHRTCFLPVLVLLLELVVPFQRRNSFPCHIGAVLDLKDLFLLDGTPLLATSIPSLVWLHNHTLPVLYYPSAFGAWLGFASEVEGKCEARKRRGAKSVVEKRKVRAMSAAEKRKARAKSVATVEYGKKEQGEAEGKLGKQSRQHEVARQRGSAKEARVQTQTKSARQKEGQGGVADAKRKVSERIVCRVEVEHAGSALHSKRLASMRCKVGDRVEVVSCAMHKIVGGESGVW